MYLYSGSVHQILDAHQHYVQGVAWDPLAKYIASLSSDRTCRIYVNKPQSKAKGNEKMNYVCQHVIAKAEPQIVDESKVRNEPIFNIYIVGIPSCRYDKMIQMWMLCSQLNTIFFMTRHFHLSSEG